MSNIKFKIAAKTHVGCVRANNEDNLQAASDLTTAPMKWVNNQECDLGNKGALLIVADGMGGMNAGEVASEIAINTVKEYFAPKNITDEVLSSKVSIESFMKKSIVEADKRIKQAASANPGHKGMGTTIVIAWILEDKLYVAWCGDSRAYIYNRANGLRQISKDHSYVQQLVDQRKINPEDAFDYPDSNIITRCLCDGNQKARPDTLAEPITLCNNDIVLLCTDGLCGMIRDHEIAQVISEQEDDMSCCADDLINAACEASGQDNITIALCKILSGCAESKKERRGNKLSNTIAIGSKTNSTNGVIRFAKKIAFSFLLLPVGFGAGYLCCHEIESDHTNGVERNPVAIDGDTIYTEPVDSPRVKTSEEVTSEVMAEKEVAETEVDKVEVPETVNDTIKYVVKKDDRIFAVAKSLFGEAKQYDVILKGMEDTILVKNGKLINTSRTRTLRENDTLLMIHHK